MPIIDTEEGTLGPLLVSSVGRLQDVENDGNAILIVGPDNTLVGVCSIGRNNSIPLD
jgi:hypothetical protein